jgi:kynurenine formamidase
MYIDPPKERHMNRALDIYRQLKQLNVYDISPRIHTKLPAFPSHPNCWILKGVRTRDHHGYNCNMLVIGEHMGAHIDAPMHTCSNSDAKSIDMFPADYFVAPYKKYALDRFDPQPGEFIDVDRLRECEARDGFAVEEGDIVLLQYGYDKYYFMEEEGRIDNFYGSNAPGLTEAANQYLLDKKIRAIGADSSTCEIAAKDGKFINIERSGHEIHYHPNNIPIMENFVHLRDAPAEGLFLALPWKIDGGSGCPVQVLLYG